MDKYSKLKRGERSKRAVKWPKILLCNWTAGVFFGIIVVFLRMFRLIRVKKDGIRIRDIVKLTARGEKVVVIFNHPSMFEAFILPNLFFPFSLIPVFAAISLPDHHFYWSKWFAPFRSVCIPIPRDKGPRQNGETALNIVDTINRKFITLIGAEGGRTYKGEHFKEKEGHRLRRFERGVGKVLEKTDPFVVLAWSSGGDKIMPNTESDYTGTDKRWLPKIRLSKHVFSICFAPPIRYSKIEADDKLSTLEDMMLDLANR